MRNRTVMSVTALAAIALISFLALWRDSTKISDAGSSSAITGTAASRSTPQQAGLSRLDETLPGRGGLSEQATQPPVPAVPLRAAAEPAPSMGVLGFADPDARGCRRDAGGGSCSDFGEA